MALQAELDGFSSAERIRLGFEVAIIGPPNAGKSSLLNRLAKRDVAIVSDRAGTTRDVIELQYDLNGLAVSFLDTAGLREAADEIEEIGIGRAFERARCADLRIHLSDDATAVKDLWQDGDIVVSGHADLGRVGSSLAISAVTGQGIGELLDAVAGALSHRVSSAGLISHERQRAELIDAVAALDGIEGLPGELVAEKLRMANGSLDRLLGRIGADDYLDLIFSSFCIGK